MRKMIRCISPIDGSLVVERPVMTIASAGDAVSNARAAQDDWAARPLAERVKLVMKGVKNVGAMNDKIVLELAWQMGRPVRYGGEFGGFHERAAYMSRIAGKALAPIEIEDSDDFVRSIERIPHGLVFVIAPWNYPFMTAINTVAPALIAGNSVMLKHASQTLLVGERMAQGFHDAGIPRDVFQNVVLDHDTTSALVGAGSFDFVNFTGSVAGGQAIERAAAGTFTGLGLELGGKDPAYVMEDADLDAAVSTLMDAAMYNTGQCCCGIERIYVARRLYDDFVARAVKLVSGYRLGNPLDPETTMGPMARERFANHVRAQTREAIRAGATAHIDPATFPQDKGAYLMPQILTGVDHSMRVMREESFGPVVGIMPIDSDDEAIGLMNDSDYGLTASLWSSDVARAREIGGQLETGTVFLNRADYLDPALCWTGCKQTGRGGGLSEIGFHNLTRPRSYHFRKPQ